GNKMHLIPPEKRMVIIIATDDKFWEMVGSLTISKLLNPLKHNFIGYFSRLLGTYLRGIKQFEGMSDEEKKLKIIEVITGAELRIPRYTPDHAARLFTFAIDHQPINGAVYSQHPIKHDHYLLPASGNLLFAKEKMFIFNELCGTLGAKKVKLLNATAESKNWRGKATVPISEAAAQVGLSVNRDSNDSIITQICAEFGKPEKAPYVPKNLTEWVKRDEVFGFMARNRLSSAIEKIKITLELKESLSLGANVTSKFKDFGFEVGGKYKKIAHSKWLFEIEYWP
ncbi:hypothetical protein KA005_12515, partial [bacterium]|nr:hypothetical protein [bacterium]